MWRVRLCLAGGGRRHVGYFADEGEGAAAYFRALDDLRRQHAGPLPARPAAAVWRVLPAVPPPP